MDPSKNYFFWSFWRFSGFSQSILINFGSILGPPGGCFLTFSAGQISNRFFHRFLKKKNMLFSRFRRFRKNTDPIQGSLQNAWFWQGGKMRGRLGKTIDFSSQISSKIDEKSFKKSRWTQFAAKVDKIAFPGTVFVGKNRFWVVLGIPGVIQKSQKTTKKII